MYHVKTPVDVGTSSTSTEDSSDLCCRPAMCCLLPRQGALVDAPRALLAGQEGDEAEERDGLRRAERGEHGHDPAHRGGLRRVETARRRDDSTLGVVGFSIFPHLDHEMLPENTMADAERWAAGIEGSAYAIDDQTAITVTNGTVDVVSEGHWKLFSS
jgi:hypothetical protein